MDPEKLIQLLRDSGSPALEAAAKDAPKWLKLRHCKGDLELFLQFNIAHLRFKPLGKDGYAEGLYTSNTRLASVLQAKTADAKKKAYRLRGDGMRTKDALSVMSYNIIEGRPNTISLQAWEIVGFITINPDNALILDQVLNCILNGKDPGGFRKKK